MTLNEIKELIITKILEMHNRETKSHRDGKSIHYYLTLPQFPSKPVSYLFRYIYNLDPFVSCTL